MSSTNDIENSNRRIIENNGNKSDRSDKMNNVSSYLRVMKHRKTPDYKHESGKVWSFINLASIGFGSTLGFGVYILIGHVASVYAGPSTLISFSVAGFFGFLTALSYIEFTARLPLKSGSTYNFISTSICEFIAFVIGWNLILEYIIGAACVARSFTLYLDTLLNNTLVQKFTEIAPINSNGFATYFDLLGFLLPIFMAGCLSLGLRRYGIITTVITIINIVFIWFIIIIGIIKANASNWNVNETFIIENNNDAIYGRGGFIPFDVSGIMGGAAICIFVFLGFDSLSKTINQETFQESQRRIPLTFLFSFTLQLIMYIITSIIFTLMAPYFNLSGDAWIPVLMEEFGWSFARWIIAIGGVICLLTSLFILLHSVVSILNDMIHDGILFAVLGKGGCWSNVPVIGILIAGTIAGIFAGLFSITQLVNMLALGTIFAFIGLPVGIILLRFSEKEYDSRNGFSVDIKKQNKDVNFLKFVVQLFNCKCSDKVTRLSFLIVKIWLAIYICFSLALAITISVGRDKLYNGEIWIIGLSIAFLIVMLISLFGIFLQPRQDLKHLYFKLPFVPLIPGIAIFIGIYLLTVLHYANWIRFGIWMFVGLIVYTIGIYFRDSGVRNESIVNTPIGTSLENIKVPLNGTTVSTKPNTPTEIRSATSAISITESQFSKLTSEKKLTQSQKVDHGGVNGKEIKIVPDLISSSENDLIEKKLCDANSLNSSTKSYDEITSISEVPKNLKEKKEPNGNTYFIEDEKKIESERSSPKHDNETKVVLAFLDNIILDEESRPNSILLDETNDSHPEEESEISTAAIVHAEDTGSIQVKEIVEKTVAEPPDPYIIPIAPPLPPPPVEREIFKPVSNHKKVVISSKPTPAAILRKQNDDSDDDADLNNKKQDFRKRLTLLIAEKSNQSAPRPKTFAVKSMSKVEEKEPRPVLTHSRSDSNLKLIAIDYVEPAPDLVLYDVKEPITANIILIQAQGQPENQEAMVEKELKLDSPIPEPPAFNKELYDSWGKKNKLLNQPLSVVEFEQEKNENIKPAAPKHEIQKPAIIVPIPKPRSRSPPKEKVEAITTDNEEVVDRESIKQKLELIFQRGLVRPVVLTNPKKEAQNETDVQEHEQKPDNEHQSDDESYYSNDEEDINSNVIRNKKPYDTVKLQKMRFSDVLKSIKEDTKPSIIRNSSFGSSKKMDNGVTNHVRSSAAVQSPKA